MPQPRLDEDLLNVPSGRQKLATPALVLDLDALESNIAAMAGWAERCGIALRPHAKTHKCAAIGHLQMAAGALGLCCAKLAEAETLATASLDRLLLTSPVVGARKIERLTRLAARCAELMVVVDDADNARALAAAAEAVGCDLGVLIDVDIGQLRTGVTDAAQALALAEIVAAAPRLSLKGVQGYAGQVQHIADFAERKRQSHASLAMLGAVRDRLEAAGHHCPIVTGGGTGSHALDPAAGVLTELQVGSYIVSDVEYDAVDLTGGGSRPYRNGLFVYARVVSARHAGG
ncbi:MAG TPA: alanine racemase, partial [Kiloniellaceae bacterium]|nr:alanine racemase [Kiloniellaceae bacterium]